MIVNFDPGKPQIHFDPGKSQIHFDPGKSQIHFQGKILKSLSHCRPSLPPYLWLEPKQKVGKGNCIIIITNHVFPPHRSALVGKCRYPHIN